MRKLTVAALYLICSVIAIAVNIGTQAAAVWLYSGPFAIAASMIAGTATGLIAKYVLDKTYIFRYATRDKLHEARTFYLYTVMGIATTFIFWGTELGFHAIFGSDAARLLGGTIGLAIGYLLKYHLDKRFVFR